MDGERELERGRALCRRGEWTAAHRALSDADETSPLRAADLELLATAAYLAGDDAGYCKALERAHAAHVEENGPLPAARCAFWLGMRLALRGETARATGWFGHAQRLVERGRVDSVERGYLLVPVVEQHLAAGGDADALAAAEAAAEIGERSGDRDLIAIARHQQGRALIQLGRTESGLALFDETMVLVAGGGLSPVVAGLMYCSVIGSCQRLFALDRAREWTAALSTWCDEQAHMVAFKGICRVHRAEVLLFGGDWPGALAEAERACGAASADGPGTAAAAFYLLGELHRLRGELGAAEEAFRHANERGREPLPGLALLRLAQGRADVAAASIRRAVTGATQPWQLMRLLPAGVEVLLAAGDVVGAREACQRFEGLAARFDTAALRALAAQARGTVEMAEGATEQALPRLRSAAEVWQRLGAPYMAARARVLIGAACRALGDADGAGLELAAARAAFERLGATSELRRLDAVAAPAPARPGGRRGLTARELEVLRAVATGLTNKEIGVRLLVSERTVDRHVSNIFAKVGVGTRSAATAWAYENDVV